MGKKNWRRWIHLAPYKKNDAAGVHGTPKKKYGQLVHYLLKDTKRNKVSAVPEGHPEGKKAIFDYEVLESAKGFSLLSINLHTGRSQQIALWAHKLSFDHPVKKEPVTVYSQPLIAYPWHIWQTNGKSQLEVDDGSWACVWIGFNFMWRNKVRKKAIWRCFCMATT